MNGASAGNKILSLLAQPDPVWKAEPNARSGKKKSTATRIKKKARTGLNPATGEKIKIKATKAPKFKASKTLKDLVK